MVGEIMSGAAAIHGAINNTVFGALNYHQQKKAMEQQLKLTRETNEQNYRMWQEQRDDARHALEYSVQDAKNAGLNPASVAGTSGTAAPSPIPAQTPDVKAPQWDVDAMNAFAGISAGVNEMLDVERKTKENEFVQTQINDQNMKNDLFLFQVEDMKQQMKSQIELLNEQIKNARSENEKLRLENEKQRMFNSFFSLNGMFPATAAPDKVKITLPFFSVEGTPKARPERPTLDGSKATVQNYKNLSKAMEESGVLLPNGNVKPYRPWENKY